MFVDGLFAGKKILVTGGGTGLGKAMAERFLELGAEIAINHRDGALAPALRAATGGQGVDVIYDPVGAEMAEDAAGALARNGRHLLVGFAGGRWPRIAAHDLVIANASLPEPAIANCDLPAIARRFP